MTPSTSQPEATSSISYGRQKMCEPLHTGAIFWSYFALFADEGADRTAEFLKLPYHVERRVWLDEIPAFAQSPPSGNAPVEDPRQLGQQPVAQPVVLAPVEAVNKHQYSMKRPASAPLASTSPGSSFAAPFGPLGSAARKRRDLIDAFNELHPETLRIGSVNPAD
jgi:hypothetical protein